MLLLGVIMIFDGVVLLSEEERVRQLEDDKKKKIEEKLLAIERQKAENEVCGGWRVSHDELILDMVIK